MRAAAGASVTDAICRIPRMRRAFEAEAGQIRQRLQRLETMGEAVGYRVTRSTIGWFWRGVFVASAGAFAAGYAISLSL